MKKQKLSQKEILIKMGFTPNTIDYERARYRLRYKINGDKIRARSRERRASDPALRERERARKRAYERTERAKALAAKRAASKTEAQKARKLANQRKWYRRNAAIQREKIRLRKIRRNPTHGLKKLADDFAKGNVGLDEFTRRYSEAVERLHGKSGGS